MKSGPWLFWANGNVTIVFWIGRIARLRWSSENSRKSGIWMDYHGRKIDFLYQYGRVTCLPVYKDQFTVMTGSKENVGSHSIKWTTRSISKIEVDMEGGIWILQHSNSYNKSFVYLFKDGVLTSITGVRVYSGICDRPLQNSFGTIWLGCWWWRTDTIKGSLRLFLFAIRNSSWDHELTAHYMWVPTGKGLYRNCWWWAREERWSLTCLTENPMVDIDTVKNQIFYFNGEKRFYVFDRKIRTLRKELSLKGPLFEPVLNLFGDSLLLRTNNGVYVYQK